MAIRSSERWVLENGFSIGSRDGADGKSQEDCQYRIQNERALTRGIEILVDIWYHLQTIKNNMG